MAIMNAWQPAPQKLALAKHTLHIWRASLALSTQQKQRYLKLLDTEEQTRASRFYFDRHRNRYIASRAILRIILSYYLNISPESICFSYGSHGKPFLDHKNNKDNLQFNMSHSDELAIYAVTQDHEIGIDIEKINDRCSEGISRRFFVKEEHTALMALPIKVREQTFFHIWTQKEAFIKAIGQGLSYPLDKFIVNATGDAGLIMVKGQPHEAENWFMQNFFTATGFCSALATRQSIDTIYYWDYVL